MSILNKKINYFYNGRQCKVIGEIKRAPGKPVLVAIDYGDEELDVARANDLKVWEETWQYKQEQEAKSGLEKIKKEKDKIVFEIKTKAVNELKTRMLLNSVFGDHGGKMTAVGVAVANELGKLIDKQKI